MWRSDLLGGMNTYTLLASVFSGAFRATILNLNFMSVHIYIYTFGKQKEFIDDTLPGRKYFAFEKEHYSFSDLYGNAYQKAFFNENEFDLIMDDEVSFYRPSNFDTCTDWVEENIPNSTFLKNPLLEVLKKMRNKGKMYFMFSC